MALLLPTDRGGGARPLVGYGLAALGPIAAAGAQFLLSLQLLHALPIADFGRFAFLLVAAQLSLNLAGALLAAPYPALLRPPARDAITAAFLAVNLLLGLASSALLFVLALALGTPPVPAGLFALYAGAMLLRAFGRAHAYAHGTPQRAARSDFTYALVLTAGIATAPLLGANLTTASAALLLAALAGLAAFGPTYLAGQFQTVSIRTLLPYRDVWRRHSKWSLLGVLTTEATGNAHAYILTLVGGPAALAPLAASALLVRPVALVTNALVDLERPRLARQLAEANHHAVSDTLARFRLSTLAAWLLSAAAATLILAIAPKLLFPPGYDPAQLWLAAALWFVIALLRSLRTPENVLLQADGRFRTLAFASVVSALVSIAGVLAFVASGQFTCSLIGLALGELVFALGIWSRTRRPRPHGHPALP